MRIIRDNRLSIISQKLEVNCEVIISVRKSEAVKIFEIFEALYKVKVRRLEV